MARQKKAPRRGPVKKLRGLQARVGGVGKGVDPFSNAPRTLPKGASPRVKPRGSVQDKRGGSRLNPNNPLIAKPRKKRS